jgi:hypothetical protein
MFKNPKFSSTETSSFNTLYMCNLEEPRAITLDPIYGYYLEGPRAITLDPIYGYV